MAYRPPDEDPYEMKGKRPPEETQGGMQDTSIDDAERDFGVDYGLGSEQSVLQATGETSTTPSVSFDPYDIHPPLPPRVEEQELKKEITLS